MPNNVEAYCPTCSQQVTLVKKTNWPALILCAVFGGVIFGTIAYCVYDAVFRKADTCPQCKKKVSSIVQAPVPVAIHEPYCPNCGKRNDADAEFCRSCGQRIAGTALQAVVR